MLQGGELSKVDSRKGNDMAYSDEVNLFQAIGKNARLSERTVRKAFRQEKISYKTACRLAKALNVPVNTLRYVVDKRRA